MATASAEIKMTPEIAAEQGVTRDEYARIQQILGRDPNITELGNPLVRGYFIGSLKLCLLSSVAGAVFGAVLAYAVASGDPDGLIRRLYLSVSGVLAQFGGVTLAFAFLVTVGPVGLLFHASWYFDFPWGIVLIYTYFQIPLMVLVFLPAIDGLKVQWREASESLGSSSWQYWRYVGGPLLAPAFLGGALLLFANALSAFATIQAAAQLVVIGDMSIMHHSDIGEWTRPEGMGVADIDAALGCHARMRNTMRAAYGRETIRSINRPRFAHLFHNFQVLPHTEDLDALPACFQRGSQFFVGSIIVHHQAHILPGPAAIAHLAVLLRRFNKASFPVHALMPRIFIYLNAHNKIAFGKIAIQCQSRRIRTSPVEIGEHLNKNLTNGAFLLFEEDACDATHAEVTSLLSRTAENSPVRRTTLATYRYYSGKNAHIQGVF